MTDLEKVAEAIYRAHGEAIPPELRAVMFGDPLAPWEEIAEPIKANYRKQAAAAIRALLPPSEAMVEAGERYMYGFNCDRDNAEQGAREVFTAMLGAILKDSE
ncbi:MAG TPA: hypothetical protein VEA41_10495 [Salinarimonas sp.]|nr:hypothetical protein [Salinarimonas sp.]